MGWCRTRWGRAWPWYRVRKIAAAKPAIATVTGYLRGNGPLAYRALALVHNRAVQQKRQPFGIARDSGLGWTKPRSKAAV